MTEKKTPVSQKSKKISVIIPVYNAEKYIDRCIDSVIGQTYACIECILIDDGSKDNSKSLIKTKIANYCGGIEFVFLENTQNRGVSYIRNQGISYATG
jgi:glycosyltransferase involved in cell wall biosynthesis